MILLLSANRKQKMFSEQMNEFGYKTITTFYLDFSIADTYGEKSIRDTYKRAHKSWKSDYKYMTELYIVLNHKIWEHYDSNNEIAKLYDELWRDYGNWCDEHFTKEELSYFYDVTD